MAKNFPYFKFIVTEWMTGNIVYESFAVQGLFINICALYWQRDGVLSLSEINKRYKNPVELPDLIDHFFKVENDFISIKFLDEQLIDANHISVTNSANGSKGGRPKKTDRFTTALRPLTESKAKESKEEVNKNKRKEEYNAENGFDSFWLLYPKKVAKEKCRGLYNKMAVTDKQKISETLEAFISYKPFDKYTHPNPYTYLSQKRFNDPIPALEPKQNIIGKTNQLTQKYDD